MRVNGRLDGAAQVRRRRAVMPDRVVLRDDVADVRNKLTYDLVYVKRMSWAMDARILFWTFGTVSGHNAN